jgi:hypothetical protein
MPGAGGTQRISRLVGLARALDWVLRGRIVPPEVALQLGLVHEVVDDAPARALELAEEIAILPPMSIANAKRALYLGADSNLQAAYEIENMNWTEVMQSDDAKIALKTFLDVDPSSRRDWFESANSKPGSTETSLRSALSSQVGSLWQSPGVASRRCTTSAAEMALLRGQPTSFNRHTTTPSMAQHRSDDGSRPQTERRPQCAHPPTGRLPRAVICRQSS